MGSGTQPSRALLVAAGVSTQLIGAVCLVLALASIPVVADLGIGMSSVIASIVAAVAAIVCGTLVWRGRLIPLALAAGLDVGFGIALPRGGSALTALLHIVPADEAATAESLITAAALVMFVAAILCVLAVPSALALRKWARDAIAESGLAHEPASVMPPPVDESAPTKERPRLGEPYQPSPGTTLRGFGPSKLIPTQVIHVGPPPRGKPALVIGVAITLIAIGIIVITAATSSKPDLSAGLERGSAAEVTSVIAGSAAASDAGTPDAGAAEAIDAEPPPVGELVARFHEALRTRSPADLALVFDRRAFAIGVDANDLAEGRDSVIAQLRDDIGEAPAEVTVKFSHTGQEGDVAWLAEELGVGARTFAITAVLGLRDGAWTIAALHWAEAMPNPTAYKLARAGDLAVPDVIPNTQDASPLAQAMRAAFASKSSFLAARSMRADAFNFGSAPRERLVGGAAIEKVFRRIPATIRLHDAVKVGALGERGGWGVANVDFTDADKDGTEVTQTFRVLAAWLQEDAGWRIVLTQWSNPR